MPRSKKSECLKNIIWLYVKKSKMLITAIYRYLLSNQKVMICCTYIEVTVGFQFRQTDSGLIGIDAVSLLIQLPSH